MSALRRRLERVERACAHSGRLIVVRADNIADAEAAMAMAGVELRPTDSVIKIRRRIVDPPHAEPPQVMSVHPEGINEFFLSIDGRSVPLVKEPTP